MAKILVAYFSRPGENYVSGAVKHLDVGNAQILAEMIAKESGGDLYRIETVAPYATDYYECIQQAQDEKNANARPALKTPLENADSYDVVFLVYPNWWGTMPMVVYTFLETYGFAGATIYPLCTSEGSGMSGTDKAIARTCPEATVGKGLEVLGSRAPSSESTVAKWVARSLS